MQYFLDGVLSVITYFLRYVSNTYSLVRSEQKLHQINKKFEKTQNGLVRGKIHQNSNLMQFMSLGSTNHMSASQLLTQLSYKQAVYYSFDEIFFHYKA